MIIGLVSFAISSPETGWKSEVEDLFIHGCKGRSLFRIWNVQFLIFCMVLSGFYLRSGWPFNLPGLLCLQNVFEYNFFHVIKHFHPIHQNC